MNIKRIGIFSIAIILLIVQPVNAKWFQKKTKVVEQQKVVKYTVETARQTAFNNVQTVLSQSFYKAYLTDALYRSNLSNIQSNYLLIESGNTPRALYPSYCGKMFVSYGIRYCKKPEIVWFYGSTGKLLRFELDNNAKSDVFPRTSLTYNNKGILSNVTFYVSTSDQYNFDGKGNLIIHWVGTKAYNRYGKLMKITRQI